MSRKLDLSLLDRQWLKVREIPIYSQVSVDAFEGREHIDFATSGSESFDGILTGMKI